MNFGPPVSEQGSRVRVFPAFAFWVIAGVAGGVTVYRIQQISMGGEAVAFIGVGVAFGCVGGTVYGMVVNRPRLQRMPQVLRGLVSGTASAISFVVLDAIQSVLSGAGGPILYLPIDLTLIGFGVVAGTVLTALPHLRESP